MLEAGFIWISPHKELQAAPSAICWDKGLPVGQSSPTRPEWHQSSDLWPQGSPSVIQVHTYPTSLGHWDAPIQHFIALFLQKNWAWAPRALKTAKHILKFGGKKKVKITNESLKSTVKAGELVQILWKVLLYVLVPHTSDTQTVKFHCINGRIVAPKGSTVIAASIPPRPGHFHLALHTFLWPQNQTFTRGDHRFLL